MCRSLWTKAAELDRRTGRVHAFPRMLNWLVIPVVAIGLVLGLFSDKTTGRNINLAVLVIAMFRLFIGGGLI